MTSYRGGSPARSDEWQLSTYRDLLCYLRDSRGSRIIRLREFARGVRGVWLRHDVELDLEASVSMARVENEMGISSSYFICIESPFFDGEVFRFRETISRIMALGHEVGYHLVISHDLPSVETRLCQFAKDYPAVTARACTFHAPGTSPDILAKFRGGWSVYTLMARGQCNYFSDSARLWRWGNPIDQLSTDRPTQLLVHPFWWSGDAEEVMAVCRVSERHRRFLPQLAALQLL